jgi:hypothetical protein
MNRHGQAIHAALRRMAGIRSILRSGHLEIRTPADRNVSPRRRENFRRGSGHDEAGEVAGAVMRCDIRHRTLGQSSATSLQLHQDDPLGCRHVFTVGGSYGHILSS